MRFLLNRRNIYHSIFYIITGLALLFLWLMPQVLHYRQTTFSALLMTLLMVLFFLAVGIYGLNQVCRLTVDKDGVRRKNLLFGELYLPWDEIEEIGEGWFWRRRKSGPMLYLSRKALNDERRRGLDDFDLSQGIILPVAESAGRFGPTEAEAIAYLTKTCPGPKTPLFHHPEKSKREWVRRTQLHYVLRKKNPAGEMEYTNHTLMGPDPNRKGMI
jgi:hypothetical protein